MRLACNKILILGILLSVVLGLYYLFGEPFETTPPIKNVPDKKVTSDNIPAMDELEKQEVPADKLDTLTQDEKRKYYKTLLREKGSSDIVRMKKYPLQDFYSLLDKGLVDTDQSVQLYSTVILRQYSIYQPDEASIYLQGASFREDAILDLLDSDISDLAVSAFSVLASTHLEDEIVVAKLINAINSRQDDDMSKLEMIRELGRHREKHSDQIKEALINVVLDYQPGASGAGTMIDAALVLSRYENKRPESIFPYICKAYEAGLYDSPALLHVFDNYAKSGIGCVEEMERVIDKMKRNEIKIRQPTHAKLLIDKTQQVIDKIRGN